MMQPTSKKVVSEKMLWSLLKIMTTCGGSVCSSVGCDDPLSPESQIIKILLGKGKDEDLVSCNLMNPASVEAYNAHVYISTPSSFEKAEVNARIETLLLCGNFFSRLLSQSML